MTHGIGIERIILTAFDYSDQVGKKGDSYECFIDTKN
jgi:hypothetical protein